MLKNILISLRPKQWVKNIVIFAGLIFSQNLLNSSKVILIFAAAIIFCVASSSIYFFNDIFDKEQDSRHPHKKLRPIASGKLHISLAFVLALLMAVWSLGMSYVLGEGFFFILLAYLLIELFYSLYLKNVVILDVFCIASGFLLRVLAGAIVISVPISHWLLICTIFLSLFLALGKRRGEMVILGDNASSHRPVLEHYDIGFIDQMITVVTASTVLSYVLYALSPETVAKFHTDNLKYTIGFVVYGIFRYLYLVYRKKEGGTPERLLFQDKPLLVNLILYLAMAVIAVYK